LLLAMRAVGSVRTNRTPASPELASTRTTSARPR
jgi:hypothetical protein